MNVPTSCALAALVATTLLATGVRAQDPDQVRSAIGRTQRELQQVRGEAESLLDARIRYDLGLPIASDLECFRNTAPATTPALEQAQRQLAEEDSTTSTLLSRYERLRQQVELLRTEAQKRTEAQHREEEWITVPVAGAGAVQSPASGVHRGETGPPPVAGPTTPAPEQATAAAGAVRVVPNLEPIRAQITGSSDHGLVAQALFKAGQALMDRAAELRAQGQSTAADQVDDEARQRLTRAVEELKSVASGPGPDGRPPEFSDLFHLGKCRELLFRIAERRDGLSLRSDAKGYQRREQEVRDPFVAITARDVVTVRSTEQLGPWGRAAQAAMDHFRWMNLHAAYAPKVDPSSITWTAQAQR